MSNEVNLAAPGRVMRNLSGEQARAHERMANLPRRVISRQPTEAELAERKAEMVAKIQRTFKNNALNLKSNPGFTGRKGK
jgi:glycerol-3-phosphate dehydrogenase